MHKYTDSKKQAIVDKAQQALERAEALKKDLERLVEIARAQAQQKNKESK